MALGIWACSDYEGRVEFKPKNSEIFSPLSVMGSNFTNINLTCCPAPVGYAGDTFHLSVPINYIISGVQKSAVWFTINDSLGNIIYSEIETALLTDLSMSDLDFVSEVDPGLSVPVGDHADCLNACFSDYTGCLSSATNKSQQKLCNKGLRLCKKGCRRDYIESIIKALVDDDD